MMPAKMFTEVLQELLSVLVHEDRFVVAEVVPRLGGSRDSVHVTFVNLPKSRVKERRGGGAESENNRMLFAVRGFDDDDLSPTSRVTVEMLVNNTSAKRMRKKTDVPIKIATYLAAYINEAAASLTPRFTHE